MGEVGSAGGWSEWRWVVGLRRASLVFGCELMAAFNRSEGRVMELDDRLARLEQALQAKLAQLDRSAELDDPCLHAADHFETSSVIVSTTEMDEDGVRRIQDGVRRLSVKQNASAADPREVLIAKTNEQKLNRALSAFELGWMHETLIPGPGAWSGVGAVEQEGKERMARELKELVEELAASRMDAISPVLDHTHPPNPHSNIYPLHSDLSPWRSDADSHFGAHSSFASSPSSPWTEPSSPRTPHSPYTPFQLDSSEPQVAFSPSVGSSPMGFGRLSLGDEQGMAWEAEQCAVVSWRGEELFGKQQTALFAPRGRARTLDEAFQPTPPPPHYPSYPLTSPTLSHMPQHSSLGLWDSSPPPSTHSSLGLIFSPFPPTFITASTSPQAPLTRTHSLESTSSTPPPFSSTYSPLARSVQLTRLSPLLVGRLSRRCRRRGSSSPRISIITISRGMEGMMRDCGKEKGRDRAWRGLLGKWGRAPKEVGDEAETKGRRVE